MAFHSPIPPDVQAYTLSRVASVCLDKLRTVNDALPAETADDIASMLTMLKTGLERLADETEPLPRIDVTGSYEAPAGANVFPLSRR
jgi:hypothetical protein